VKLSTKWRNQEALEIRNVCMVDAPNRADFYHKCRNGYRYGSRDVDQARHNKIMPILKRQASFLYAPERVHFWPDLPPDELEHMDKMEAVADAINDSWHDTGSDTLASDAVENALVCGCAIISVLPERMTNGSISMVSRMIKPEMFGVFRPDVNDLLQQQAICWDSYLSRPEIEVRLLMHSPRERAKILQNLETQAPEYVETDRIFVSNYQGINSGNVETGIVMSRLGGQYSYNPHVGVGLYKVSNLYVFDDDIGDWSWLLLSGSDVIFDLPISEVGLPGTLPVIKVQADTFDDYFWGWSLSDGLALLQQWYSKRISQMDELFEKILKPPKVGYGVGQMRESKIAALNRPMGYASMPNPASKIEELKPTLPESAFTMMDAMDEMFVEAAMMQMNMFGQTPKGVRTDTMGQTALKTAASPITVKALRIERGMEDWANLIFKYKRRYDDALYPIFSDDAQFHGKYFRFAELPSSTRIKVDGHSASPVFVEDHARMAEMMVRAGSMDPETLIEFINPPMKGLLKKREKRRVMAQLVAQAIQKQKQEEKRHGNPEK